MKKLRRMISLSLLAVMCFSIFCQAYALDDQAYALEDETSTNISATCIESESINETISSPDVSELSSDEIVEVRSVTVNSDGIIIEGSYDDTEFRFCGDIYTSSLCTDDNISYVADLTDTNGTFTSQYCEITTTDTGNALFNEELDNSPVFKLYFTTTDGDFVACESTIDELTITGLDGISGKEGPDATIDSAWFVTVLEPYEVSERPLDSFSQSEIDADEGLVAIFTNIYGHQTARVSNSYLWAGNVYSQSFKVGTETIIYRACPSFSGSIGDVPKSGSDEWSSCLTLSESVTVNGTVSNNYTNIYSLKNMHCEIGAGTDTCLTSRQISGTYVTSAKGTTKVNFTGVLAKIINAITGTTTATTIASWINSISYTSGTESITTGTKEALSANTRVVGVSAASGAYINDASHQISVYVTAKTMSNYKSSNVSAPCVIRWSFDLYDSSGYGSTVKSFSGTSAQKTVYYTAVAS